MRGKGVFSFFPCKEWRIILYKATVLDELAPVISGKLVLMILEEIQIGGRSW
jgi:hypothetical protein